MAKLSKQEVVFLKWSKECEKLFDLRGFFQNDFEKMIIENDSSLEHIEAECKEFIVEMTKGFKNINKLAVDVIEIVETLKEECRK